MEQSGHEPGKNTFLSRVFGLQSDDVSTSIHTQELSTIPLDEDESNHGALVESEDDEDHNDGVRLLESDPGTSTQDSLESDTSEEDERINGINSDSQVIDTSRPLLSKKETMELHPFGSQNGRIMESSIKLGQPSSDEEDLINVNESLQPDLENRINPIYHEDKLDKALGNSSKNIRTSTFLDRVLKPNDVKKNSTKKRQNSHNYNPTSTYTNSSSNTFLNTVKGEKSSKKYKLKRPNILNALSVVNNMPERRLNTLSPKERALWKWANVDNLDLFLQDAYNYYLGNGFHCIILQKVLNILTLLFVVFVSSFMGYCVDYSKLPTSTRFSEIKIDHCYSQNITGFTKFLLFLFYGFVILKVIQLYFDINNIREMKLFYHYLLNISDDELQTIPWQNIIQQLMYLKDQNALTANVVAVKAKNKLNAHGIANRIMRKENYLIALYNNDILDLRFPIPFFGSQPLTKTLEWNINLCVMGYVFNEAGFIKQGFLKATQKEYFANELRKRFMLAGFLNIILSPFLVSYFVLLYFFRYFNEYKTSPENIGARQYTPMAEWKFREYNELYHIFRKRIGLSNPLASKYVDQFPKEKTNILLKFASFISGSFVAILAILALWDPENFLNFEVTHDKTVLFYITVLGAIWSISQGSVSTEYHVFDPEETLRELAEYTHYLPDSWKDRYHTEGVKQEFCELYNLRITVLLRELASLITTPFILWFSLPNSAGKMVDFFRESSVYVDGLGYVCKYAVYDGDADAVKKHFGTDGNETTEQDAATEEQDIDSEPDEATKKMMQSYMYFLDDYENDDNLLGKYQIPKKRRESFDNTQYDVSNSNQKNQDDDSDMILANRYTWRKQFKPGQKPELFRIGNHVLNDKTFTQQGSNHLGIDESYARSQISNTAEESNRSSLYNSKYKSPTKGVLGLVKEYYKKSDVGR